MSEVGIDPPVSILVGLCERASGHVAPESGMIKFGLHGTQAGFDIAKTLSVSQLRECHTQELIETRETSHSVVAAIMSDAFVELVLWKEVYQLRENDSFDVHGPALSMVL